MRHTLVSAVPDGYEKPTDGRFVAISGSVLQLPEIRQQRWLLVRCERAIPIDAVRADPIVST